MGRLIHSAILILTSIADISLTILSIAFYNKEWKFDFQNIIQTLNITKYSYWTSPLDFIILSIFRQIQLIVCFILVRFGKSEKLKNAILIPDSFSILYYVHTIIKLLVFDETPGFTSQPGVIVNVGSSVIFSFASCILLRKSILNGPFDYQPLNNEENEQEDSETPATVTPSDAENGTSTAPTENGTVNEAEKDKDEKTEEKEDGMTKEEKEKRLPLMTHIWLIVKLCSPQWKWYLSSYGILLINCALNLIEPALYSSMLSNAIAMKSFDVLKKACLFLLLVQFLEATTSTFKTAMMSYAERTTTKQIRISLFKAILHQDISFFDENNTGQLMSRITHDSDSISHSLPGYIETTTTNLINLFGSLPIMLYYSWQMTLTAFIVFPITMILTKIYGLYVEKLSEQANDATAVSNETVEEVLGAIRTVRSFASERLEFNRYTKDTENWFKISLKSVVIGSLFNYIWYMIWNIEDVVVYLYGGYLTLHQRMPSDSLLAYVFYHWRLHSALHSFSSMFTDLMTTIGSSRKVIYLLNRNPELDFEQGTEKPEISGNIIFDGVEFAYPTRKNVDVLQGLKLNIEPGKTIALVGPSGNGKTTIVSLIQQFYKPRTGQIQIDGTNISDIDHEYYHSKIALVAQEPALFSGSVKDNILYGIENGTEEDMLRVAKMANVHEFVSKMEKGYNTKCGEKGVQMSGGQKQRIAIARALIRDPAVLILDEATSALDAESEAMVQEALNRCSKNRTVIVIAHRLSTVKNADKIAVIEKGNVTEIGSHTELMANNEGLYYKLVSRQLEPKKEEPSVEIF